MAGSWDDVLRIATRGIEDARDRLSTPRVRFEVRRKAFHVAGAIVAVPITLLLPFQWAVAFGLVVIGVILVSWLVRERRLRVQGLEGLPNPVADAIAVTRREGETFPWSPIAFTLALVAVGASVHLAGLPLSFAFAAYGILGVGDAASALIGVAYGRHKLPWNGKKSWEGTVAGVLGGFLSAAAFGNVYYAARFEPFPLPLLAVFAVAAVVGALVESLPKIQDNWAVPLASLAAMLGAGRILGLV